MIELHPFSLQQHVSRLNAGEPYTFIRLCDGEWSAILQDRFKTASGSQTLHHATLRNRMIKVITHAPDSESYILSTRTTSYRGNIEEWLEQHTPPHVTWYDCTALYKASKKGRLYPFVKALRGLSMPIVVIGPARLARLNGRAFDIKEHVVIPNKNCWAQRQSIMERALDVQGPACYLLSAGPAAKPFAWVLHRKAQGSFILDTGSLWDPYVGRQTRVYHKSMNRATIHRNLTGT